MAIMRLAYLILFRRQLLRPNSRRHSSRSSTDDDQVHLLNTTLHIHFRPALILLAGIQRIVGGYPGIFGHIGDAASQSGAEESPDWVGDNIIV